jgi:hypothetical protein
MKQFWKRAGTTILRIVERITTAKNKKETALTALDHSIFVNVKGEAPEGDREIYAQRLCDLMNMNIHIQDNPTLPLIVPMDPLPPNNNPFNYDLYNMGSEVGGAWMAMYDQHSGLKQEYNMTDAEKEATARGEAIWYPDPAYIIMANQRTGQRFKLVWPGRDMTDVMNRVIRRHGCRKEYTASPSNKHN